MITAPASDLRFQAAPVAQIEGLIDLYQRMVALVGHFAGPEGADPAGRLLLRECDRTYVAICAALLLLAGVDAPTPQERADLFDTGWRTWFPELATGLPALSGEIRLATWELLHPGVTAPLPPLDAFARARTALLAVHRLYVERLYGRSVAPDWAGLTWLRRALVADYYDAPVRAWLQPRHLDVAPARWAVRSAYQVGARARFAQGTGAARGPRWPGLLAGAPPPFAMYLAAWCTLSAAGPPPDPALLRHAQRLLAHLPNFGSASGPARAARAPHADAPSPWTAYHAVRERLGHAHSIWENYR